MNLVQHIALAEHLLVDPCLPSYDGNEVRTRAPPRDSVESSAPRYQIVEIDAWRTSDDAVEIGRELLRTFDTLTSTKRASQIVRFGMALFVESLRKFLSCLDACV